MKKILITGAGSYIGTSFENWIRQYDGYTVDTVDMIDGAWRGYDFSGYDAVFHVAGIAHRKETKENAELYYKVNRDLAIETARRAKESGAGQFILLSSMSVYGVSTGTINGKTPANPVSNYGKSKLAADMEIEKLSSDSFKVSILRPPMVYGKGCKGNYQLLRKSAIGLPFFPSIKNKRSMIYINNLCEFVKQLIDRGESGYFWPQDYEYICTSDMVRSISESNNKRIIFVGLFNPLLKALNVPVIKKVFGTLVYEKTDYGFDYWVTKKNSDAIKEIEG